MQNDCHAFLIVIYVNFVLNIFISRFKERGQYMSHAETLAHSGTARNLQQRWHALYGLRIVSILFHQVSIIM